MHGNIAVESSFYICSDTNGCPWRRCCAAVADLDVRGKHTGMQTTPDMLTAIQDSGRSPVRNFDCNRTGCNPNQPRPLHR